MDPSRRDFIHRGTAGLGGAWIAVQLPAIEAAAAYARESVRERRPLAVLTDEEARELEAIASRIIPTDETPGATEAGVIHFIDRALETFQAGSLDFARQGLAAVQDRVASGDTGATAFSALSAADQDALLREIEGEPFFGLVRYLTVAGMFTLPSYGGNRDGIGWQLLGFEDRFRWAPPFGYYDGEGRDG